MGAYVYQIKDRYGSALIRLGAEVGLWGVYVLRGFMVLGFDLEIYAYALNIRKDFIKDIIW
jgi:hypothetical protein